jgi:hypothetical protein
MGLLYQIRVLLSRPTFVIESESSRVVRIRAQDDLDGLNCQIAVEAVSVVVLKLLL